MASLNEIKPKEPGRNELCPCGSGKKYKKCCMVKKVKKLTRQGFEICFMKLVQDAGGSVDVSCEELEKLLQSKDKGLAIGYNAEEDLFHFEMVKVKKSPIIQADKRIRV